MYSAKAEAEAAAKAEHAKQLRNTRKITLTFPSRTDVTAEAPIVVENLRPAFDHEWVVTKATHSFDDKGYTTNVEATTLEALQIEAPAQGGIDAKPTVNAPDESEPDDQPDDTEMPDEDLDSGDTSTDPEPSSEFEEPEVTAQ
jgi:hypothetical protein